MKLKNKIQKLECQEDIGLLKYGDILREFETGNLFHWDTSWEGKANLVERGEFPANTIVISKDKIKPESDGTFSLEETGERSSMCATYHHTDELYYMNRLEETE